MLGNIDLHKLNGNQKLCKEFIKASAQDYYNLYGYDEDNGLTVFHENNQKTPVYDLIKIYEDNLDKETLIQMCAILLEAGEYRTMDIAGLIRQGVCNDEEFITK